VCVTLQPSSLALCLAVRRDTKQGDEKEYRQKSAHAQFHVMIIDSHAFAFYPEDTRHVLKSLRLSSVEINWHVKSACQRPTIATIQNNMRKPEVSSCRRQAINLSALISALDNLSFDAKLIVD
jgi:hypothetical protein